MHTGKREMLSKGLPQIRQSEGNSVANRAAAMPLAPETKEDNNGLCRVTAVVWVARIGCPLLLKTILPRPDAAAPGLDPDESLPV